MKPKINPVFKALCPPLAKDEHETLEANIAKAGRVREPIVLWKDDIVDGHNRFEIANRLKLPYDVVLMSFRDEHEAKDWIILNQLGRRNMDSKARSYLRGKLYINGKQSHGGQLPNTSVPTNHPKGSAHFAHSLKTSEKLAVSEQVDPATVRRDADFAEAVDNLAAPVKDKILSGNIKATKTDVQNLAEHSKAEQKAIVQQVESGEVKSLKAALAEPEDEQPDDPNQAMLNECQSVHRSAKAKVHEARRLMEGLAESQSYLTPVIGRIKRDLTQAATTIHQMEPQEFSGSGIVTRADQQRKG